MQNPEADRAAAMMRQRMARTNQTIGMESAHQMPTGRPSPPPSMAPPRPGPPPPGAMRSVKQMTGSSRQVPPGSDPLNRYRNMRESATGAPVEPKGDVMLGVNKLVVGVISAIAFGAIFVLPRQLKVFWVLVVGLAILITLGMHLYKELMEMSKGGGENAKYAEWAWVLLFSLTMMYTGVMVGILLFLAWSLYTIANSKTNITRNDSAVMSDYETPEKKHRSRRSRHEEAPPPHDEEAYI